MDWLEFFLMMLAQATGISIGAIVTSYVMEWRIKRLIKNLESPFLKLKEPDKKDMQKVG